jgi:hypothetical protein
MEVINSLPSLRKTYHDLFNIQYELSKKYANIPKCPLARDDEKALQV